MRLAEFHSLIDRFHKVASSAVIDSDGLVHRLVGDEVAGLFMPLVGDHARLAVLGALQLLEATGHRDEGGPWVPVGIGIHTGIAYVGAVGLGHQREFTALGDAVNVAARLASAVGAGELLVSEDAYLHAGLELGEPEHRRLELKGRAEPIDVRVVRAAARRGHHRLATAPPVPGAGPAPTVPSQGEEGKGPVPARHARLRRGQVHACVS